MEKLVDIISKLESARDDGDTFTDPAFCAYFEEMARFLSRLQEAYEQLNRDTDEVSTDELARINALLYEDIRPENYETSYVNPTYAARMIPDPASAKLLCAIATEVRALIPAIYDGAAPDAIYSLIEQTYQACTGDGSGLKDVLYTYVHDSFRASMRERLYAQVVCEPSFKSFTARCARMTLPEIRDFIHGADAESYFVRFAYLTGEYISDNELRLIHKLCTMDPDTLESMTRVYVNGYIKGFEVTSKDISIKSVAGLMFNLGFLPMVMMAAHILYEEHGLKVSMRRAGYSILTGRSVDKGGYFGTNPNPQYDLDHKDDLSLILDEALVDYRLTCLKDAFEELKSEARGYAGPAVIEIFGEPEFTPVSKPEAASYDDTTLPLTLKYTSQAGVITNEYIPGEERSFTIIAWPVPSICEDPGEYDRIFDATCRINTLDYELYRNIQQRIIDVLDTAEYVRVTGMGDNRTALTVHLHKLDDPAHQTNFENCVADVNIPVGEVFTSPLLSGTQGVLHVTHVFLDGIEYHDLEIKVHDGFITGYSCAEGAKLIEDNILYHHPTLPMGECAIGTNTTAYVYARRLGIESRLPILIAEKTGPHFAFGDTCYSHEEDLKTYNPDGKEIIARENEASAKRKEDPAGAYFNCHTDVTIPYDELGRLCAVRPDGTEVDIISNGRFVLKGCEALNTPFD